MHSKITQSEMQNVSIYLSINLSTQMLFTLYIYLSIHILIDLSMSVFVFLEITKLYSITVCERRVSYWRYLVLP